MRLRDRGAVDRATATLAAEQIGKTRHRTPEGYLLCEGARIARTGPMIYRHDEMPDVEIGPFGRMITILRDADVLFAPETVLSFAGKPITNDHPDENVTPSTYRALCVGTVLNPRQGEGVEAQYLLGDLLITDEQAIADVEGGKVQLSPGYDCEVEQIQPGLGRQTFVLGNHVALVDQGRGGTCEIQDGEPTMATRKRIMTGLRLAFKAKDEAAFEEQLGKAGDLMDDDAEGDGDGVQRLVIEVQQPQAVVAEPVAADPADPIEARFAAIEGTLATIADSIAALAAPAAAAEPVVIADEDADEDGDTDDDKTVAMDAASKAEILVPGIRVPTFDSATIKRSAITSVRRSALSAAYVDTDRRKVIDSVLGGRSAEFAKMKSRDVATVFDAAAAVVAASNNAGARPRTVDVPQGPMTAARYAQQIKDRRAKKA